MNELDQLRNLDHTRDRLPDAIDVTDDVMRTLRTLPGETNPLPASWAAVAVVGWSVAIGMAVVAGHSVAALSDPLAALMR